MENKGWIFTFFCVVSSALLFTDGAAEAGNGDGDGDGRVKLFVFGDSYADTGNSPLPFSRAWNAPYGITFPGKPSGRFSDGRVLTDYLASYLGIRSPTPYQLRKNWTGNGVNFAHGGTGVFTTLQVDQPNMTTQIDFFQQLLRNNPQDLGSSIALVSVAGNDYATYLAKNATFQGLAEFTRSVVDQLILNVKRIKSLGIKKIAMTGVGPLGCLPANANAYAASNCNALQNNLSQSHNKMLKDKIWALNSEAAAAPVPLFVYFDLYTAFTSALQINQNHPGGKLKPCCIGDCGSVEKNGKKKYAVCEKPTRSFFWDSIHPSNSGWAAVFSALNVSLHSLLM